MAATKAGSVLLAPTSCAAAGTQNSSTLNATTAYDTIITASVTNGSSAPTIACSATVWVSYDGSTWRQYAVGTAGITASTAYSWVWDLGTVMYAYVQFTGNTGQAVTVACEAQVLTGL